MKTNRSAFITLISVFFFWGFVAASNDILIPVFKDKLRLEQWQSQLISVAFYVAYTVGSAIYLLLAKFNGTDLLSRIGYKNGIALGLCISAAGTLLFYPAAQLASFNIMITGLFVVALGFSLQQTAANPLAIVIGDRSRASQRLSLAGGVNNVGTTIGPLVVSLAIFGSVQEQKEVESVESLKYPYLVLGAAFLIVAFIFKLSSLPNKIEMPDVKVEKLKGSLFTAFPQLGMGMLAIFLYVGVEVSTASNLPEFMRVHADIGTSETAPYISLFWASLMIGRWTNSAGAFETSFALKSALRFMMPFLAFGVFLGVNLAAGADLKIFYPYTFVIFALIFGDLISRGDPARQLVIYSLLGTAALFTGMLTEGMTSVYALISVGLFCSTLWPCIFTLAITGLGSHTSRGSSYLIMMIMGGGLVSWFQGWLAGPDLLGIRASYMVGVVCFLYLGFYGWKMRRLLYG